MTVHPSARAQLLDFLDTNDCQYCVSRVNQFKIYSKSVALKHIYNVFEPLAADEGTKGIFKCVIDSDFDQQVTRSGQVVCVQLESPNNEFRMNEHIFQKTLASDKQFVHKI